MLSYRCLDGVPNLYSCEDSCIKGFFEVVQVIVKTVYNEVSICGRVKGKRFYGFREETLFKDSCPLVKWPVVLEDT